MFYSRMLILAGLGATALFLTGCAAKGTSYTNPDHPGPAVGQTVGEGVGVIGGNIAGAAVGAVEGTVDGVKKPFTNERHIVRTWHTETTSDGRTIQVPVDTEVDENGRPVAGK